MRNRSYKSILNYCRSKQPKDLFRKNLLLAFAAVSFLVMYTYFANNKINDLIKIGRAIDVKKRIASMSSSMPFVGVSLLFFIEGNYERHLHNHFKKYRVCGEWFSFPSKITESDIAELIAEWGKVGISPISINERVRYEKFISTIYEMSDKVEMEFIVDPKVSDTICNKLSINNGRFRGLLSKCIRLGHIAKKKSNWYILNPNIFFKGNEIARAKMFEMSYRWEIKEKGFKRIVAQQGQ